jgi:predicted dehydrogenase
MKPIRIAIIGYGKIAADQHVPSIQANDRFELVATSSRSGQGVARTFTDWREHPAGAALRDRPRVLARRAPLPARKAAGRGSV